MSAIDLTPPAPIVVETRTAVRAEFQIDAARTVNTSIDVAPRTQISVFVGRSDKVTDRDLFTVENHGQTVFILSKPSGSPHLSQLFLNSNKALFGRDYIIDGVLLNWRSPLLLDPSDKLEIFY